MNVLFLIQNIVPYHVARISSFANHYGHNVYVLESNQREDFSVLNVPHQSNASFTILRLDNYSSSQLKRIVLTHDIGFIFCSGYSFASSIYAICIGGDLPNVRVFACCESNYFDHRRFFLIEKFKSIVVSGFSGFLVGSQSHGDYIRRLYKSKLPLYIMLGYDVVDNQHFMVSQEQIENSKERTEVRFISVSRFESKKNLLSLIQAFSCVVRSHNIAEHRPDFHLYLVGTGSLESRIREEIAKLDLGQYISLTGPVPYEMLPKLYAECDVIIHPSTTEQWGLVINEAMSAGLAVLCSKQTGASKVLVDTDNGIIFDAFSVVSIANAIRDILAMPRSKIDSMRIMSIRKVRLHAPLEKFSTGALALINSDLTRKPKVPLLVKFISAYLEWQSK